MSNNDVIDVHAHFLTNRYLNAALGAGITHPDGMLLWPHWSLDEHLELMAQNRIQRAILSISSPGVHFGDDDGAAALARDVNDFAAEISREYPQRFGFFASLPLPAVDAAVDEAARAIDKLGALGVIVMSNSDGQYLGDPALNPLWALLNQRQAITFVHPTSPPHPHAVALDRPRPMVEFMFETTRTITDMIFAAVTERYPDIRFLIPHCGATLPLVADRVELFRKLLPGPHGRPPARLSTRHQLQRFWYDLAGSPLPTQADVLIATVGDQQILYGSDFCWTPAIAVAHHLASLDQDTKVEWRALTAANAKRFLTEIST